jgi:RNA polymerase sigma-70 factor, ECF subfamily
MIESPSSNGSGSYETRYRAFLETITQLRPRLHRFCTRMVGSAMDGEDVVQEALFEAYRKLEQFDDRRPLAPWLFRIVHNRSIDCLRRRGVRIDAEADAAAESNLSVGPEFAGAADLQPALEHLVRSLPPKERACVLLKDVLGHSLEEIAMIVDSTVGGVKAALVRGRAKLAVTPAPPETDRPSHRELARIVQLYVDRFNRRDWNAVRELVSADARLCVADRYFGPLAGSPYFSVHEAMPEPWRMVAGELDGEPVVIILQREGTDWAPMSPIRFAIANGRIVHVADYNQCRWMLRTTPAVLRP